MANRSDQTGIAPQNTGRESNIDKVEISKFDSRFADWWDKRRGFRGLHDINPARLEYINNRANITGKRVLDIGCGGGILSEAMAALGAEVTGIDMGEVPLAVAQNHLQLRGLTVDYRHMTAETMAASRPESFDVVTCLELLEHVPNPASVVRACRRLVKPHGDVFFATLNRTLKSFVLAIIAAEYILGIVHRGTHQYRKFIRPSELEIWARNAGLALQNLTGLHYNPIRRRCWLGGNVHVNYLMHFKKL
jgi:2-polyprenyl-6-hydroxyphenyl methylase/3-demethylubiquinone-9 3-methyltransferase